MSYFTDALAKGIAESNKGLPAHSIMFTSGENKGLYLGWSYNAVKGLRSAMRLVRSSEPSKWVELNSYAIEKLGPEFKVIPRRKTT